jgi:hypothetical protein
LEGDGPFPGRGDYLPALAGQFLPGVYIIETAPGFKKILHIFEKFS